MNVNWAQVLATVLSNTAIIAVIAFLAKKLVERWLDRNLEAFKSQLKRSEIVHETKFALLHERQASVIAELYSLLVRMLRNVNRSAKGIHQYVDDEVDTPRQVRQAMSIQFLRDAYNDYRAFDEFLETNRIYLSDDLIAKTTDLKTKLLDVFNDLEVSHQPTPPGHDGLPPSIRAIWEAQKKLRLLVHPIRSEIELEFRRILGVIDESGSE
jgi:hypothetical protein